MPKEKINIVSAVPYQLCPKCNGQGQVCRPQFITDNAMTTNAAYICDVCNGNKIIPMFIIKTN